MNDAQHTLIQHVAAFLSAHDAEAYLVGGPVRDLLLNRPVHDLDFVVTRGDSLALARALADDLHEPFVLLDEDFGTARVVVRHLPHPQSPTPNLQPPMYLDFNRLRAPTLKGDLAARDFTINAIAAALPAALSFMEEGRRTLPRVADPSPIHLVDPFDGQRDMAQRVIRVVSDRAFRDDPLRMLRAVRQAVELGFTIDPDTQALVRRDVSLIDRPAAERIRDELVKLFAQPHSLGGVETLDQLGLLTCIVPELGPAKDMTQPSVHQWDVFQHVLETLRALEWLLARLRGREAVLPSALAEEEGRWTLPSALAEEKGRWTLPWAPDLSVDRDALQADRVLAHLDAPSSAAGTRAVLLKFATLLHDIAKPQCRSIDVTGRIRFFRHESEGAPMAATVMRRLRFSTREAKAVANIVAHHMRPAQLATARNVTRRAVRRFLQDAGGDAVDLLLLSLCDHLATRGTRVQPSEWEHHMMFTGDAMTTYFRRHDRSTQLPRLLSGHDLMTTFGLEPGKRIGTLLGGLREAQILGQVSTRDEALAWVAERLQEEHS